MYCLQFFPFSLWIVVSVFEYWGYSKIEEVLAKIEEVWSLVQSSQFSEVSKILEKKVRVFSTFCSGGGG